MMLRTPLVHLDAWLRGRSTSPTMALVIAVAVFAIVAGAASFAGLSHANAAVVGLVALSTIWLWTKFSAAGRPAAADGWDAGPAVGRPSMVRKGWALARVNGSLFLSLFFAFFASLAAFLTMADGMWQFTRPEDDNLLSYAKAILIAVAVAVAVQGVLRVTSYIVATSWAQRAWAKRKNRQRREFGATAEDAGLPRRLPSGANFGIWIAFLLCFFVSVFFAYNSLFGAVFKLGDRKQVELSIARSEAAASLSDMKLLALATLQRDLNTLGTSPEWKQFRDGVDSLLEVAAAAEPAIRSGMEAENQAAAVAAARIREEYEAALAGREDVERKIAQIMAGGGKLTVSDAERQRRDEVRGQVEKLQVTIDDLFNEMAKEDGQGGTNADGTKRPTGRGPSYRKLEKQRDGYIIEQQAIKKIEKDLSDRINEADASQGNSESALKKLEDQKTPLDDRIAQLKAQLDGTIARQASTESEGVKVAAASPQNLIKEVRDAMSAFVATGSDEHFGRLTGGCTQIVGFLEGARNRRAGDIGQFSADACSTSGIGSRLDQLQARRTGLKALGEACIVDKAFNELATVAAFVDRGRECLNSANLDTDDYGDISARLDTVERENSDTASNFTRAVAGLKRQDTLALLALFLAVAIDSVVFFSAYSGAFAAIKEREVAEEHEEGFSAAATFEPINHEVRNGDSAFAATLKVLLSHGEVRRDSGRTLIYVDTNRIENEKYRVDVRGYLRLCEGSEVKAMGPHTFELTPSFLKQIYTKLTNELLRASIENNQKPEVERASARLGLHTVNEQNRDRHADTVLWPELGSLDDAYDAERTAAAARARRSDSQPGSSGSAAEHSGDNVTPMPKPKSSRPQYW